MFDHEPLLVPSLHMNGTSYDGLASPLASANAALRDAMQALAECAPNARDYYVQDGDALRKAQAQHRDRIEAVVAVEAELMEIMIALRKQYDAQKASKRTPQ